LTEDLSTVTGYNIKAPTLVVPEKAAAEEAVQLPKVSVPASTIDTGRIITGTYNGQRFFSDSYIVDLAETPGIANLDKAFAKTTPETASAEAVKMIGDYFKNATQPAKITSLSDNNIQFTTPDKQEVLIDKKYLDYFRKKYDNITFKAPKENPNMLAVYSNAKPVGLVMGMVDVKYTPTITYKQPIEVIKGTKAKPTGRITVTKIKQPSLVGEKILETTVKQGKITPTEFVKAFAKRFEDFKGVFTYDGEKFIPEGVKGVKVNPMALGFSSDEVNALEKGDQVKYSEKGLEIVEKKPAAIPQVPGAKAVAEIGKAEIKPSKIAKSIEAKAIEAKLTKGFEKVAGYEPVTVKEEAEKAVNLVNTDIEKSRRIIRGEEPLPEGLKGISLITAMEEYLSKNPDRNMIYELANSPLVSETSAAAQELRLAQERDSAAVKLADLKRTREEQAGEDIPKKKIGLKDKLKEEIKKLNLSKEDLMWEKFLDSIRC
jgi:hypothetical protein